MPFGDAQFLRLGLVVVQRVIEARQLGERKFLGLHQRVDDVAAIVRALRQPCLVSDNLQRLAQPEALSSCRTTTGTIEHFSMAPMKVFGDRPPAPLSM